MRHFFSSVPSDSFGEKNASATETTYVVGQPDVERDEFDRALAAAERVYRFVLAKHPELDPEKRT